MPPACPPSSFLWIRCWRESEVMFWSHRGKGQRYKSPFQLSLRDRAGYVIAWGNRWHRTTPYIIRLYANTSPSPVTFTQSSAMPIPQLWLHPNFVLMCRSVGSAHYLCDVLQGSGPNSGCTYIVQCEDYLPHCWLSEYCSTSRFIFSLGAQMTLS